MKMLRLFGYPLVTACVIFDLSKEGQVVYFDDLLDVLGNKMSVEDLDESLGSLRCWGVVEINFINNSPSYSITDINFNYVMIVYMNYWSDICGLLNT